MSPIACNDWRSDAFDVFTHGPRQLLRADNRPSLTAKAGGIADKLLERVLLQAFTIRLCVIELSRRSQKPANMISDGSIAFRGT